MWVKRTYDGLGCLATQTKCSRRAPAKAIICFSGTANQFCAAINWKAGPVLFIEKLKQTHIPASFSFQPKTDAYETG
jgi:hypothetical protein